MKLDKRLIGLGTLTFCTQSLYSLILPFFPRLAISHGLTAVHVGIIFGMYPFVGIFSSQIYGLLLNRISRRSSLLIAIFCLSISLFAFASLPYLYDNWLFITAALCRTINGLGASGSSVVVYAILASKYPENLQEVVSFRASMNQFALLVGPVIGSGLFWLMGFSMMFLSYGAFFIIIIPVMLYLFQDIEQEPSNRPKQSINLSEVYCDSVNLILLASMMVTNMSTTSFEAFFTLHMEDFNVSQELTGVLFLIPAACYILGAIILGKFLKNVDKMNLMAISRVLFGLSLMGTGPAFALPRSIWTIIPCLFFLGMFNCFATIPIFQQLIENTTQKLPKINRSLVSSSLAATMLTSNYMGKVVGPPIAGYLFSEVGYESMVGVYGMVNLIFSILFVMIIKIGARNRLNSSITHELVGMVQN